MAWTPKFWKSVGTPSDPAVTWNYGAGVAPSDVPASQVTDITNYINSIAAVSTLAASRLNAYGQDIRIGYNSGNVGQAFRGPIDDYILIDLDAAKNLYFFNSLGQLVPGDVRLTIMHELAHNYLPGNDPDHNATEATMNGADFDFRGPVIDEQNTIAQNAGLTNQIQTSYYATVLSTDPLFGAFTANSSYSQGRAIEITRLGGPVADNIDHSSNTKLLTDLLFGLGGDDKLNGGKGSDYLYGGEQNDTFVASDGDDLFHGGGTRRIGGSALGLEDDGIDTADYSAAAATEFIKITTDVAANTFHSGAIDAAHRALIQQNGAGNGTATIISIEKVTGTAGVDTFEVTQLVAAQLAGSDGKGGLAEIDLAGNDKPSLEGDLIDATKMMENVVIDLDPANGFVQVEGDAERKVTVLNAERAWGGKKDDKIDGNDQANQLIGGDGADVIKGGGGDDVIRGGDEDDAGDRLEGGGGNDEVYAENGDTITSVDGGDTLYLNGARLTGGERERPPQDPCAPPSQEEDDDEIKSGTYEGRDGTIYVYDKGAGTLTVTRDGASMTIESWANGAGGITLRNERPPVQQAECNRDPLILDLNGDRSVVAELYDVSVYFDIDNDGVLERVSWALPEDGFLAIDRDGDGLISSGLELFGTGTIFARGNTLVTTGTNGFSDLRPFDTNGDLVVDAADAEFASLKIWRDADTDGVTDAGELVSLAEAGIASISLRTRASDALDCGCDGTLIVSMSDALRTDGTTLGVYDAFLAVDNFDSRHRDAIEIPDDIAALPFLVGSGSLRDLHSAMALDPVLQEMVEGLLGLGAADTGQLTARVEAVLLRWSGGDQAAVDSRGGYINAQWLEAIEAFHGSEFRQNGTIANPRPDAASDLVEAWQGMVRLATAQLLAQIPLGQEFLPGLTFEAGAFFVAADGVTLPALLQSVAAQAPAAKADAIAYWHVALGTIAAAASEFGASASQVDAAAQPHLDSAGLGLSARDVRLLTAGGGSDLLSGTATWRNSSGADLLLASDGATIDGGSGDDTYIVGRGMQVTVRDGSGLDELWLPDLAPAEVQISYFAIDGRYTLLVRSTDGLTSVTATGAYYGSSLETGLERVRFADGSTVSVQETVAGGSTATPLTDVIVAHPTVGTLLDGGGGDDFLLGYDGDDSYVVGPGLGSDLVVERGSSVGDILLIDAPLADVSFAISSDAAGRDLIIRFAGSADIVTVSAPRVRPDAVIEVFHFSDGQTLTAAAVEQLLLQATPGADRLVGGFRDDRLDGGAGDDVLAGGGGLDTYVFGTGYGHDILRDEDLSIVEFGPGIDWSNLTVRRGSSNLSDLVVEIGGGADTLLVAGQFASGRIQEFRFADGTTADWADIFARVIANDGTTVPGTSQDDDLDGTTGNDTIHAGRGNDLVFDPGGDDTWHFELGDGIDIWTDVGFGVDTIVLGRDIAPADMRWRRSGDDLVLTVGTDMLYLSGHFIDTGSQRFETLTFEDGQTLDLTALTTVLVGTAGNDYLIDLSVESANYPYTGRTFAPGAGDDVIQGTRGTDTVQFTAGFGSDTIYDFGAVRIEFGAGLLASDLIGRREGDDLIVGFVGATDEIRVVGHYSRVADHAFVQTYRFADGGSMSGSALDRIVLAPSPGDDWVRYGPIVNGVEQNVRDGGAGNDLLTGNGSTYVFGAGYGHDIVENVGSSATVSFGSLTRADVTFSRSADDHHDIVATIVATGETLTIKGRHLQDGSFPESTAPIGQFVFADGTLSGTAVAQAIVDAELAAGDTAIASFGEWAPIATGPGDQTILAGDAGTNLLMNTLSGRDVLVHASAEDIGDIVILATEQSASELLAVLFYDMTASEPGWKLALGFGPNSSLVFADLSRMVEDQGPASVWNLEIRLAGGEFRYGSHVAGLALNSLGSGLAAAMGLEQVPVVAGTSGDDLLQSGAGAHVLAGLEGNDTYVLAPGTGHDIVAGALWPLSWNWEGLDSIHVAWTRAEVAIAWREGSDEELVIVAPDGSGSMTFAAYDPREEYSGPVTSIHFADGSVVSVETLVEELLVAGAGPDNLRGDWRDEILDGLAGDDRLVGGPGYDVYRFGRGYGHDTVVEAASSDWNVVEFLSGVAVTDLEFARGGDAFEHLIIRIRGEDSSLTILDQFAETGDSRVRPIQEFRFADGSVLTWGEVFDLAAGRDVTGDNVISTDDSGGVLDGGPGFDVLLGGAGNDIYVLDRGYDEDRISDAGGEDVLRFNAGVRSEDVVFSRSADNPADLLIEITGVERLSVTIGNQFAGTASRIEFFEFDDGTRLSAGDVEQIILAAASTGSADTILAFEDADRIDGGAGNDVITGAGGDDEIVGGDGRDIAVFGGRRTDYEIIHEADRVIVRDLRPDADGTDVLRGIEDLRFLGDGADAPLLNLEAPNGAPAAADDAVAMLEDGLLVIARSTLLANDQDPDGDALRLVRVFAPSSGIVWIGLDGDVRYRPAPDFNGTASFSYEVQDPTGATATATVGVAVADVNDAPVLTIRALGTAEDGVSGPLVGTDIDGDVLAYVVVREPAQGTVELDSETGAYRYRPDPDYAGADSFEIELSDGRGGTDRAEISVIVAAVNDAPTAENLVLAANAGAVTGAQVVAADVDDVALTHWVLQAPLQGTLVLDPHTGALTYRPRLDASGEDSAELIVVDAAGAEARISVTFTVEPATLSLSAETITEGAAAGAPVGSVLASVGGLTFRLADDAGGRFTIDPATGAIAASGATSIDFESADAHTLLVEATDGESVIVRPLTVFVINEAPSAIADQDPSVELVSEDADPGTAVGITAESADPAGGAVTYTLADDAGGLFAIDPASGIVTLVGALDYETAISHTIVIRASDGTAETLRSFEVAVGDVQDGGTIFGTEGPDTIVGSAGPDEIFGLGDADSLDGADGDDTLRGGDGSDVLRGGNGADLLEGGEGNDRFDGDWSDGAPDAMLGGAGRDTMTGGDGDHVDGGDGHDVISIRGSQGSYSGGAGIDVFTLYAATTGNLIDGGADSDTIILPAGTAGVAGLTGIEKVMGSGSATLRTVLSIEASAVELSAALFEGHIDLVAARDDGVVIVAPVNVTASPYPSSLRLFGANGNDNLTGSALDDQLFGGGGGDVLVGGLGSDLLSGGSGDDTYRFARGSGQDLVQDVDAGIGGGSDRVELGADVLPQDVTVWLAENGSDLLLSIVGTTDRLRLVGVRSDAAATIEEVAFADGTVWSSADLLGRAVTPPYAENEFHGTEGADGLVGGETADIIRGHGGGDTIQGRAGADLLEGGSGDDLIYGGKDNDIVDGGLEDDGLWGGAGDDTLRGGSGNDALKGESGYDFIDGGEGNDIVDEASDDWQSDQIFGGGGADYLKGGILDHVDGGEGGDTLVVRGFNGTYLGGADDDLIDIAFPSTARNTIDGGDGFDTLRIGSGVSAQLWALAHMELIEASLSSTSRSKLTFDAELIDLSGASLTGHIDLHVGTSAGMTLIAPAGASGSAAASIRLFGGAGGDTLVGSALGDEIHGLAGDDDLSGGDGEDSLTGGAGNDDLFGGAGADTAFFAGDISAYLIEVQDGVATITDLDKFADGDDGVDVVRGVETLSFKGGATYSIPDADSYGQGGQASGLALPQVEGDEPDYGLAADPLPHLDGGWAWWREGESLRYLDGEAGFRLDSLHSRLDLRDAPSTLDPDAEFSFLPPGSLQDPWQVVGGDWDDSIAATTLMAQRPDSAWPASFPIVPDLWSMACIP